MALNKRKPDSAFLSKGLIGYIDPGSGPAEQYRGLRANLQLLDGGGKLKLLMIASAGYGEGKTVTAINLAVSLAQKGSKVLAVDAHVRKADLSAMFNLSEHRGLTDMLARGTELADAVHPTDIGKLDVLAGGTCPEHAADLLSSDAMKSFLRSAAERYDTVIVDPPPVLHASEAKLMANYCDGVALVVRGRRTRSAAALEAKEALTFAGAKIIGVVLNQP